MKIREKIKRNKKFIIGIVIAIPFFVFIGLAIFYANRYSAEGSAVGVGVGVPSYDNNLAIDPGQKYTFARYIHNIYAFAIKTAVALCTLMIVYAGIKYITSRGETGVINEAKDILFSSLMGAALLILVRLVGEISGFDTSGWF